MSPRYERPVTTDPAPGLLSHLDQRMQASVMLDPVSSGAGLPSTPLPDRRLPDFRLIVIALGLTQITGYGTLYYGLGVLAPFLTQDCAWTKEWAFGALSLSFLAGGLVAPAAGRLADRHGAGRLMAIGSLASAVSLAGCGLAPEKFSYIAALTVVGVASSFVQYSLAFAALVQIGPQQAKRNITYLTLIAGFSSTLFWPMTAWLGQHFTWREVYLFFAAANLFLCAPLHIWLSRFTRPAVLPSPTGDNETKQPDRSDLATGVVAPERRRSAFMLTILTLALFSLVNSSMLIHMLPILDGLGLGLAALWVSSLFGPAQVMSRLITMLFGKDFPASNLALISAGLLPIALCIPLATAPSLPGALVFALVFGLATGLNSIVQGTLPLLLFGYAGYGARLGRLTAIRLVVAAAAPFVFSVFSGGFGIRASLLILVFVALGSFAAALAIVSMVRKS